MERKREHENSKLKVNNYYIFNEENNFSIPNKNKRIENIKQQNESVNFRDIPQPNLYKFKNISPKSINFNVTKSINEKDYLDLNANNEIKVLKNNKVVYVNNNLLNSFYTSKSIKKLNKINFIIRKERTSKYRGVSKNGSKWQVLIMINNKKNYLGSYLTEELAARVYDIQAIKSWGIKAKTNFVYNNIQIKQILERKINLKSDNLPDIINQIVN